MGTVPNAVDARVVPSLLPRGMCGRGGVTDSYQGWGWICPTLVQKSWGIPYRGRYSGKGDRCLLHL